MAIKRRVLKAKYLQYIDRLFKKRIETKISFKNGCFYDMYLINGSHPGIKKIHLRGYENQEKTKFNYERIIMFSKQTVEYDQIINDSYKYFYKKCFGWCYVEVLPKDKKS